MLRRSLALWILALLSACAADDASGDEVAAVGDALTAASLAPRGCVTDVGAGQRTFACDGLKYTVNLPARCVAGGCGLIVDVHGMTLSADIEDANTDLRAIGGREGYVVVQPSVGTAPFSVWNAKLHEDKVWDFVTTARAAYRIDRKRVHITGYSQGAEMSWSLATKHADEIASAAPIGFDGASYWELLFARRQVPILYLHGKSDAIASYAFKAVPQRNAVVRAWNMGSPEVIARDADYTWSRYVNARGTVFEFVEHDYAAASWMLKGHCFPGSTDRGTVPGQLFSYACKGPNAFVWGEEVVKFFAAHPLP